ncbi:hypothetical protein ID47_07270 [Candidatus Paracaedibacter acanthamoebae]|uniref:Uncharacterized protein n=1 Tax=Candidatus Odyssella acanthamoebae TaxID=91604 RepID=A0A077B0V6_9PROT|nr:hypothetical protein ID47_07270 [Candidatus Paracaedibacter acanthamoebae]
MSLFLEVVWQIGDLHCLAFSSLITRKTIVYLAVLQELRGTLKNSKNTHCKKQGKISSTYKAVLYRIF